MKKYLSSLLIACLFGPLAIAQNQVLDGYISLGLQSNQGLKQKQLDYSADLAALKEARGLFFPDLSFNARYTVAEGGRTIVFPVGDLMNPVYSTLNMLTGSENFPQIENEEFPFFRPREHETKLTLVQPIFNSEIIQNYKIRKQYTEIARIDVDRYKRELIREISKAYYQHQKASNLVRLADTTLSLVAENLRVSRRLFENDKVTIDAVYRSDSELSKVEVQKAQAQNFLEATRSYFNFLLNRPLDASIDLMITDPYPVGVSLEDASQSAMESRDELAQIKQYQQLNAHVTDLYRGNNIPGLFGVVDYGYQGEEYSFTGEDDFMLASLVMKWNLFQGTVNHHKVKQSKIEADKLEELYLETQQQIKLEVINYFFTLQADFESVQSAQKQLRSSQRAYELISRKYSEGQSSLLELIDARSSLTNAAANIIIARSDYFSSLADLEYAMGTTDPNTY